MKFFLGASLKEAVETLYTKICRDKKKYIKKYVDLIVLIGLTSAERKLYLFYNYVFCLYLSGDELGYEIITKIGYEKQLGYVNIYFPFAYYYYEFKEKTPLSFHTTGKFFDYEDLIKMNFLLYSNYLFDECSNFCFYYRYDELVIQLRLIINSFDDLTFSNENQELYLKFLELEKKFSVK